MIIVALLECKSGAIAEKRGSFASLIVSVSAMQPFLNHYACYLCSNIIKTSKLC